MCFTYRSFKFLRDSVVERWWPGSTPLGCWFPSVLLERKVEIWIVGAFDVTFPPGCSRGGGVPGEP